MVSKLQDFLDIANDEVGYEEGSGNDNKYGEHFGRNYEPWCAFFICWCADQAGILTDSDDADCPSIHWLHVRDEAALRQKSAGSVSQHE